MPRELAHILIQLPEVNNLHFSWIDGFLVLFFGYGFASAHRFGFIGDLPRCAGWVASLVLGVRAYAYIAAQLEATTGIPPEWSPFAAWMLIAIFFLAVAYLLAGMITRFRKKAVGEGPDLWGGYLLGPIKMLAAYFWLVIALLLFPSVWLRKNFADNAASSGIAMQYLPELKEKVKEASGKKDNVDKFIEKNRRKSPTDEIDNAQ